MVKVFISHASEDKADFVEALAADLLRDHEVWYDKYTLVAGMSLRAQIDQGLRAADFGIVVFSPSFFEKKWTLNELDGLVALEDRNRRFILPIWYKITEAELKRHSPIFAGRLGIVETSPANAANGVRKAIEMYQRAVVLNRENRSRAQFAKLASRAKRDQEEHDFLGREEGAKAVLESVMRVLEHVKASAEEANSDSNIFSVEQRYTDRLTVNGPSRVSMVVVPKDLSVNYARTTTLRAVFLRRGDFGLNGNAPQLDELSFTPYVMDKTIFWRAEEQKEPLSEADVSGVIAEKFAAVVEEESENPYQGDD